MYDQHGKISEINLTFRGGTARLVVLGQELKETAAGTGL